MKITLTSKNLNAVENLKETIEKKFEKLDKYFSSDIVANIMLSKERGKKKIEATINAAGTIFRAEEINEDIYESVDRIIDKLSSQMSRFKTKLVKKHKSPGIIFDAVPEYSEPEQDLKVVKTKKFQLEPMNVDEAVMQMELLQHNFFVFLNMENDSVNVVYRRQDGNYGLLETVY